MCVCVCGCGSVLYSLRVVSVCLGGLLVLNHGSKLKMLLHVLSALKLWSKEVKCLSIREALGDLLLRFQNRDSHSLT